MKVFISWSGERSRAVAEALRSWLPKVIQAVEPFVSFEDIDKGTHWRGDIAENLEKARAGIVCLTRDNLSSSWLLFEAGALSKAVDDASAYVCTYLLDLSSADVKDPLAQFQATVAEKDDTLKLLKTINGALENSALNEQDLAEIFEVWWPRLSDKLNDIPEPRGEPEPDRSDSDKIDEILNLTRGIVREKAEAKMIEILAEKEMEKRRSFRNFLASYVPSEGHPPPSRDIVNALSAALGGPDSSTRGKKESDESEE